MSTIVGYLYKGQRYTPLAIKEVLIREGRISRDAFEPKRHLGGGLGYPLPEPSIDTVVDAYANTPNLGRNVFMDQPETYSDQDWPKFIFDDEVMADEQAFFTGRLDLDKPEKEERVQIGDIIEAQGWGTASTLAVALAYIDHVDLTHDFVKFAQQVADEENQGSDL